MGGRRVRDDTKARCDRGKGKRAGPDSCFPTQVEKPEATEIGRLESSCRHPVA